MISEKETDCLRCDELGKLDFRLMGNLILEQTLSLSQSVNKELLEPISKWLDDPPFMAKFDDITDSDAYSWADYKRRSRQWDRAQRRLARERLKLYWQEIRQKKKHRQEISILLGKACPGKKDSFNATDDFLLPIIRPFSKPAQTRRALDRQFLKAMDLSVSYLLPWRAILLADIKTEKNFSDLKIYLPEDKRMDKVCKLMNLLQLENDGVISLNQKRPFEDVKIQPENTSHAQISIKDRQGNQWDQDWFELCSDKKNEMIEKIKSCQVICKQI